MAGKLLYSTQLTVQISGDPAVCGGQLSTKADTMVTQLQSRKKLGTIFVAKSTSLITLNYVRLQQNLKVV